MPNFQLYNVDHKIQEITDFLDAAFDPETGELTVSESDYEFESKRLENLLETQEDLLIEMALSVKNDKALVDILSKEKSKINARKSSIEKRIDLYRELMLSFMDKRKLKNMKGALATVSVSEPKKIKYNVDGLEESCIEAINSLVDNAVNYRISLVKTIHETKDEKLKELFLILTKISEFSEFLKIETKIKKTPISHWLERHYPAEKTGETPIEGVFTELGKKTISIR